MKTTKIQIARILGDALAPGDLARVAEAIESYLNDCDPEGGVPNPTLARLIAIHTGPPPPTGEQDHHADSDRAHDRCKHPAACLAVTVHGDR